MPLVLASSSPRRQELLSQALQGLPHTPWADFSIVSPDIDETALHNEPPAEYVTRLARAKAQAGFALSNDPQAIVLGSDTIVVCDDVLLGKPANIAEAKQTLTLLSGRRHQVYTAVALHCVAGDSTEKTEHALVCTEVQFTELLMAEIDSYIASGEPMDKAGAYGIQGLGGNFVKAIDGSYSAVVGLPLVQTRQLLRAFAVYEKN